MAQPSEGGDLREFFAALRFAAIVIGALCLVAIFGCTPTASAALKLEADSTAAIEKETRKPMAMTFAAVGDTLKPTFWFKVQGRPDSVVCVYSGGGSATSRKTALGPTPTSCPAGQLIPSPALNEGDSTLIAVNWTLYKSGTATVSGGPYTRYYKKPVLPPSLQPDSLTVIGLEILLERKDMTSSNVIAVGDSAYICPAFRFKDGKVALRAVDRDTVAHGCVWQYATRYDQKIRLNPVQFKTTGSLAWIVAGPASAARQAVIDTTCIYWNVGFNGGSIRPNPHDAACAAAHPYNWSSRPSRPQSDGSILFADAHGG